MYPEHIMKRLRGRAGLDENNKSRDERLQQQDPETALRNVVGWELGDASWATIILGWAKDCGYRIELPPRR